MVHETHTSQPDPGPQTRLILFGCPLDPDERHDALREKRTWAGKETADPYLEVLARLRERLDADPVGAEALEAGGVLPVAGWLRPAPPVEDLDLVEVGEVIAFVDGDGCRAAADGVDRFVSREVLPDTPVLVGIDHSLAGGVVSALSRWVGPENLSLVVLDAHTDALPVPVTAGAVQYDAENNPRSVFDAEDPYLHDRPDSYNASSFLHHLLEEGVVAAANLYLVGVADLPPARAARIEDPRMARYVDAFASLGERGATVIPRDEAAAAPLKALLPLRRIDTPYVYVSVDLDVAARAGVDAVRFRDREGMSQKALAAVLEQVVAALRGRARLVGFDVTEFDPRRAAADETVWDVAADAVVRLARLASVPSDIPLPPLEPKE